MTHIEFVCEAKARHPLFDVVDGRIGGDGVDDFEGRVERFQKLIDIDDGELREPGRWLRKGEYTSE